MSQPRLTHARLEGANVIVRPIRREDAPLAFPLIHAQTEIIKWLAWSGPADEAELAEAYVQWNLGKDDAGANYRFAIETPGCPFVGAISVRFEGHPGLGDVGYWVAARHWGRGIGTEANRLVAHLCFVHLGARAMTATVYLGNHGSARLLEKVGYVREVDAHGVPLVGRPTDLDQDSWTYGLTRYDFQRASAGWTPREETVQFKGA